MSDTAHSQLAGLSLGKSVEYLDTYSPALLQAVPRAMNREPMGLTEQNLPFTGQDIWTGYELSWLNHKGKPNVAILQCIVPFDSPNLIESKSFKLYLNSFNQSHFDSVDTVKEAIAKDLSACAGAEVAVEIFSPTTFGEFQIAELEGTNIDDIDVEIDQYQPDVTLLKCDDDIIEEKLVSNLLKSNCLITHQPDWASIQIHYRGAKIEHASLLKYLISFRKHNEFHEQCVERIFMDITKQCSPEKLTVYARYTRRGGLDINPFRSNFETISHFPRQARQ